MSIAKVSPAATVVVAPVSSVTSPSIATKLLGRIACCKSYAPSLTVRNIILLTGALAAVAYSIYAAYTKLYLPHAAAQAKAKSDAAFAQNWKAAQDFAKTPASLTGDKPATVATLTEGLMKTHVMLTSKKVISLVSAAPAPAENSQSAHIKEVHSGCVEGITKTLESLKEEGFKLDDNLEKMNTLLKDLAQLLGDISVLMNPSK